MHWMHTTGEKLLFLTVLFAVLLPFVLAACGSTQGSGSGSGSTPTPTPTRGTGTAHGCPGDSVVTSAPPAANVTIKLSDANSTIPAHVGDVIEVQLPFGLQWSGPAITGSGLQLQTPAGYASSASGMCIWRFLALHTGTTHLSFSARAICKPGQVCPQFVLSIPFTIVIN